MLAARTLRGSTCARTHPGDGMRLVSGCCCEGRTQAGCLQDTCSRGAGDQASAGSSPWRRWIPSIASSSSSQVRCTVERSRMLR